MKFIHTATIANTFSSDYTDIDNPLTNNNPNAIVLVTPNWNPGGVEGAYNNHSIGVWYNSGHNKWSIFNQDIAAMPVGASFNVLIPTAGTAVFVHTATLANKDGDSTYIDNPLTNNHPNAIVIVTPNWNPGNVGGTYNNHPIGVWYDGSRSRWAIFNQDESAMPVDAAFNVMILTSSATAFVHTATGANTLPGTDYTDIDNSLTNNNPNAIVLVTLNWNPGGLGGTRDSHPIGVWYSSLHNKWSIFNEDVVNMPVGAAFNVVIP